MALRKAYKQQVNSDNSREQLGSINSVSALTRGPNHGEYPGQTGTRVTSQTKEVIDNAFGFLKNSVYDTYSRYGSDSESDRDAVNFKENFSFGPPRIGGGYGPTSRSYDGDAPRDRRYPVNNDDILSYDDDIRLANGHVTGDVAPEGHRMKMLPRISVHGGRFRNDGRRDVASSGYPYEPSARSGYDPRPYYRSEFDSFRSIPDIDENSEFSDFRQPYYEQSTRPPKNYSSRNSDQVNICKDSESVSRKKSKKCLLIAILVIAFLIVAAAVVVIALHFLGYFTSSPQWQDGYYVEAVFDKKYNPKFADKNSASYKEAASAFKALTEQLLDNSTYKDLYQVDVKDILNGSTKYVFELDLLNRTEAAVLTTFLRSGYKNASANNLTDLKLKSLNVTRKSEYTTTTAAPTTVDEMTTAKEETTTEKDSNTENITSGENTVTVKPNDVQQSPTSNENVLTTESNNVQQSPTPDENGVTTESNNVPPSATPDENVLTTESNNVQQSPTPDENGVTTESNNVPPSATPDENAVTTESSDVLQSATPDDDVDTSGSTAGASV